MPSSLTPPKSPGSLWGASDEDVDAELDAAFASLEIMEELMAPEPKCDAVVTIEGRRIFFVKSSRIRE